MARGELRVSRPSVGARVTVGAGEQTLWSSYSSVQPRAASLELSDWGATSSNLGKNGSEAPPAPKVTDTRGGVPTWPPWRS